jgi:uncharacterized protein (DUF433 family)
MWDDSSRTRAFQNPEDRHQCPARTDHLGAGHGPGWDDDDSTPDRLWGDAIRRIERVGGRWWAHNEEYATEVSFCPWCGVELRMAGDDRAQGDGALERAGDMSESEKWTPAVRRLVGAAKGAGDVSDIQARGEVDAVPSLERWLDEARAITDHVKALEPGSEVVVSGWLQNEVLVIVAEEPDYEDLHRRLEALRLALRDFRVGIGVMLMGREVYEATKDTPGTVAYQLGSREPRQQMDVLVQRHLTRSAATGQGELFPAMGRFERAVSRDPEVHGGDLCFRGTQVPVSTLAAMLRYGAPLEEILDGYPTVQRWQVEAVLDLYREIDVISTVYDAPVRRLARGENPADWRPDDVGKEAPCEQCGEPGKVIQGWPSMGDASPIVARCRRHMPGDEWA